MPQQEVIERCTAQQLQLLLPRWLCVSEDIVSTSCPSFTREVYKGMEKMSARLEMEFILR